MGRMIRILAGMLGAYVFLALAINGIAGVVQPALGAGAGEGVLRTFADDGSVYERRLAVIDDDGTLWLVSVQHFRRWYNRLLRNPDVELVQNDKVRPYRAVPVDDPRTNARVRQILEARAGAQFPLMRALWLFAEIKAVRLDPLPAMGEPASR